MSRSGRVEATQDEMDMLEAMMDRMGQQPRQPSPNPSPRPPSTAFPTRTSSRASSASRLSTRSSSRSLNSLHPPPAPGADHLAHRPPSALSRHAEYPPDSEEETTPSLSQGEWGASRPTFHHARSQTTTSNMSRTPDDSSSLRSYASRDGGESSSLSGPYAPSSSRSTPSSPVSRPRPATASGVSTPYERTGSPLRLLPRSPLNNRTPLEDLTFFREVDALRESASQGSGRWTSHGYHGDEPDETDDASSVLSGRSGRSGTASIASGVGGRTSSLRAARLREDIEKEALRIRERASAEDLLRPRPAPAPPTSAVGLAEAAHIDEPAGGSGALPTERTSFGSASNVPLYPGAPTPAVPQLAAAQDDARSVRSLDSASAASLSGTTWPPASSSTGGERLPGSSSAASLVSAGGSGSTGAGSARTEYGESEERERQRARQRESREWSQTCWVWQSKAVSASGGGGGGKFSKAPLIRDVPSVMKRKSNKRESSSAHHLLSPAEAILFNVEDSKGSSKSGSSKDKEKDKDKGKGGSALGASPVGREGGWRRATGVLRDDGHFRVFSDSDKTVIHSVHLPSLSRTDVRLVDHSLFGRPNCISLTRRLTTPSTPSRHSFQPTASSSSSAYSAVSGGRPDEPLYLCFPSVVATQVWLVMAHCFARPEYYLASGAATPRPLRSAPSHSHHPHSTPGYPSDSGTESEAEFPSTSSSSALGDGGGGKPDELSSSCRIYRSLVVGINEARALGELATEVIRPGPKASWERPGLERGESDSTGSFSAAGEDGAGVGASPAKLSMPRLQHRTSADTRGGKDGEESGVETFCEVEMGGEVVARTSIRKGGSPFWNESFTFSDLPPFVAPITLRILQSSKHSSRPHLLGTATVRIPDLPRHELVEDWWAVKPPNPAKATDVVGEMSLSLRIGEEVVLPSREYQAILKLLSEDADADLASDIAHEFPSDLEEVTKILLRIYQADAQLVPRLLRLADLEVDNNSRQNRSAAILFRGNTILTKSVELYLRLIGSEYLDASIGEPIRRICAERVEIEIDPMKLKPGWKEKELQANIHALHEWTLTVWNSIYDAREKCPHDLRQIFGHIQRIVVEKYGVSEEQKNTRWTCVSAFIFLRFFVPAVLNPKLFSIVAAPPDPKSQRTLTLVAKTLQGLANFSSFGQKEPFMLPMNSFVQDNTAAFVDFVEHVSAPTTASGYRQEWTSPNAAAYLAPYRLRNSLGPLEKEGVPLLPHLIDLPRELGLLAAHISRFVAEKGPLVDKSGYAGAADPLLQRSETPSIASSRGGRSHKFLELAESCVDVHAESRRRGGGLVSSVNYTQVRARTPDPKTRTRRALSGRPPTATSFTAGAAGALRKSFGGPLFGRTSTDSAGSEELHIRNPAPAAAAAPPTASSSMLHHREESNETSRESVASRRSHRSFTINGPTVTRQGSFPPKSFSTEDLSLLASIQTAPAANELDHRIAAASPTPGSLAPHLEDAQPSFAVDEDEFSPLNPGPQQPLFGAAPSPARLAHPQTVDDAKPYSFPPSRSAAPTAPPVRSSSPVKQYDPSTRSNGSASTRSGQVVSPTPAIAPTSRIRITQETTTTTSYAPDGVPDPSASGFSPALEGGEDYTLSPTSNEEGTPYESSFGGTPFSAPLMRAQNSQTSQRSMASSLSSMSISAEISASGPGAASPSAGSNGGGGGGMLGGRRASSAGLSLGFGLGGRKGSGGSGSGRGDDDSEGGSRSSGGSKGLLSRAMGRKGSRAS
ncbi:hypothetical protein JCM8097_006889 [Rhodosporidiobolus ruineniae]